jgi:hypothetical protein
MYHDALEWEAKNSQAAACGCQLSHLAHPWLNSGAQAPTSNHAWLKQRASALRDAQNEILGQLAGIQNIRVAEAAAHIKLICRDSHYSNAVRLAKCRAVWIILRTNHESRSIDAARQPA